MRPNIVYILADDLGYGDLGCNNPAGRVPTPNLDRLARDGMRFTDAHAASSVCTPSRYSILTGRYAWRSRLTRGIVWQWDGSLIEPDRLTVAELLRGEGYRTACLGKWHLGWDWPTLNGAHPNETLPFGLRNKDLAEVRHRFGIEQIDYAGRLGGGPVDRGFDSYFGVDVPNFPPYAWFRDDRLVEQPTQDKPPEMYGEPGRMCAGWKFEKMIPELTRRAVELVTEQGTAQAAGEGAPFFLYVPLTSPHSPIVPNEQFRGMSGIGAYGDFVCEVDWVVGRIDEALERAGMRDRTLLSVTSDNGPEDRTRDDEGVYERARVRDHYSMGPLRGIKRDAWEGGHRVPFIASWPGVIPPGSRCDQLIGLWDLMATCAELTGVELPDRVAEDSVSILPLLRGELERPVREFAIHHSASGKFAVRRREWILIDAPDGADNVEPEWFRAERGYSPHGHPGELYDLSDDVSQRVNRYASEPDLVAEFLRLLRLVRQADSTR